MSGGVDAVVLAWALAALLFLLSLAKARSARLRRRGATAGMAILVAASLYSMDAISLPEVVGALVIGAAVGLVLGRDLPLRSLASLLTSLAALAGLAAICGALALLWNPYAFGLIRDAGDGIGREDAAAIGLAAATGAMACAGGVVAVVGNRWGLRGGALLSSLLSIASILFLAQFTVSAQILPLLGGMILACLAALLFAGRLMALDRAALLAFASGTAGWSAAAMAFPLQNIGVAVAGGLTGAAGVVLTARLYRTGWRKGLADRERRP